MDSLIFLCVFILCISIIDFSRALFYRPHSGSSLICTRPTLKNGRIRIRQRGRWVKFTCEPNYVLLGEKNAFCRFGKWDVDIPKCVGTQCPKKNQPPANGFMMPVFAGNVINFYCKPGYERKGPESVICEGKTWDNNMPSCIASNTKPKLFCDFEDIDLCNWNQDLNHDMDWVRDQYKTPTGYSMETGPKHDHTKGSGGNGHYMYLETSSRRVNDTARLISPIFDTTGNNTCLEFYYHMYGRTIGYLRAYMKKLSDPWPLDPDNAVFTKNGDHGDIWYRAYIDLGVPSEDYQIIMEGARGNGYVSDIAIDDIRIIENCIYQDNIITTTEEPLLNTVIDYKPIESCENRCGLKAFSNDSLQFVICDCDDLCYENNRCCPDYVDFCFISTSTIESETTIESNIAENANKRTTLLSIPTTIKNNATSTVSATTLTTPARITSKTTSMKSTKASAKTTPRTTPKTTKTSTRLSTNATTAKLVTLPTRAKPISRPPLVILKPPSTPEIYQRIIPVENNFTPPINKTIPETTSIPSKFPSINETKFSDIADISNVDKSKQQNNKDKDEERLPNIDDTSLSIEEKEKIVEQIGGDGKEYSDKYEVKQLSDFVVEFSQSQKDDSSSNSRITIIAVVTVFVFILLVGIVIPLFIKYNVYNKCIERRVNTRNNRNSQSDVRFLADNEELDFGLDDGYDNL